MSQCFCSKPLRRITSKRIIFKYRFRIFPPVPNNISVDKNMVSSRFFFFLSRLILSCMYIHIHRTLYYNDHFRLFPIMTMTSDFFEGKKKKDPLLRDRHTFCGATFTVYWHLEIISYTYDVVIWRYPVHVFVGTKSKTTWVCPIKKNKYIWCIFVLTKYSCVPSGFLSSVVPNRFVFATIQVSMKKKKPKWHNIIIIINDTTRTNHRKNSPSGSTIIIYSPIAKT